MALIEPVAGLVIRYSYLWFHEYQEGREEGRKDRPCAIVAAVRIDENAQKRVLVLPITHSPPENSALAIEVPNRVKARLRLDDIRSWVVLSEANEFIWPGPDLRHVPGATDASVAYGMLPPDLFISIRDRFAALVRSGLAQRTPRS